MKRFFLRPAQYYKAIVLLSLTLAVLMTACSGSKTEYAYPNDPDDMRKIRRGKITGDGIKLFSADDERGGSQAPGGGLAVNSFLWRATLDTLSFVPLASADPLGGVIITDWYESPESPGERFKINVLILDTKLRSDGVRVSTFKQINKSGTWRDAPVDPSVARKLEDQILTRARELRLSGR